MTIAPPRSASLPALLLVLVAPLAALAVAPAAAPPAGDPAKPPTTAADGPDGFGRIDRKDPRFDQLVPAGAKIEKLADGFTWIEGPVWANAGGYLLFSEIPKNVIRKWSPTAGVSDFLQPAGYTGTEPRGGEVGTNGLTLDNDGRVCMCEHGDRRVTRLEKDGKKTVLADRFEGKRFNSPNDLVFDAKGNLYFTDPPYGLEKNADDPKRELPHFGVYRVAAADGKISLVTKDLTRPNGVCLSPDERTLYVAVSDPDKAVYMAYDLKDDGTVANGRVFFDATEWAKDKSLNGLPDGIKTDKAGNLWGTGPGGVHVFSPDGKHLGTITPTDQPTANCNWGGPDGSTLYMTSNHTVCRIQTAAKGKPAGGR